MLEWRFRPLPASRRATGLPVGEMVSGHVRLLPLPTILAPAIEHPLFRARRDSIPLPRPVHFLSCSAASWFRLRPNPEPERIRVTAASAVAGADSLSRSATNETLEGFRICRASLYSFRWGRRRSATHPRHLWRRVATSAARALVPASKSTSMTFESLLPRHLLDRVVRRWQLVRLDGICRKLSTSPVQRVDLMVPAPVRRLPSESSHQPAPPISTAR